MALLQIAEERTAAIRQTQEETSHALERERTRRSDLGDQLEHESTEHQRVREALEQPSTELDEARQKADVAERKAVDIRSQAEEWVKQVRARVEKEAHEAQLALEVQGSVLAERGVDDGEDAAESLQVCLRGCRG